MFPTPLPAPHPHCLPCPHPPCPHPPTLLLLLLQPSTSTTSVTPPTCCPTGTPRWARPAGPGRARCAGWCVCCVLLRGGGGRGARGGRVGQATAAAASALVVLPRAHPTQPCFLHRSPIAVSGGRRGLEGRPAARTAAAQRGEPRLRLRATRAHQPVCDGCAGAWRLAAVCYSLDSALPSLQSCPWGDPPT